MLSSFSTILERLTIVLASQSPRRASILRDNLGLKFEVIVSGFPENVNKDSCPSPIEYVSLTSLMKAKAVALSSLERQYFPDIIISADTIVVKGNSILEKPINEESARAMLRSLSGDTHHVLTGVSIFYKSSIVTPGYVPDDESEIYSHREFVQDTTVKFSELSEDVINAYVDSGEPMDKAGSYGIQGLGASLVESIDGCYFNVVGFPVNRFCIELSHILKQCRL